MNKSTVQELKKDIKTGKRKDILCVIEHRECMTRQIRRNIRKNEAVRSKYR